MTRKIALQTLAGLGFVSWLALTGCGSSGAGCGSTNPNATTQPNCSEGTYAKMNSDGSYGPCQAIPASNTPSGGTTTPAGP